MGSSDDDDGDDDDDEMLTVPTMEVRDENEQMRPPPPPAALRLPLQIFNFFPMFCSDMVIIFWFIISCVFFLHKSRNT